MGGGGHGGGNRKKGRILARRQTVCRLLSVRLGGVQKQPARLYTANLGTVAISLVLLRGK
ncbi:hypothetical protein HMPREF9098_1263 [Kingella denitrificans ATCC 33394]|uniref:Uncharacterized protein n=1 Tax=Kingella denitrificans ATCC 33394 TaxID=888741 RepID=F0EZS8_9NEIS|nr:hypothetical protein HMPREF9098_1263 [Kingella denitrificans ATCC 33394]